MPTSAKKSLLDHRALLTDDYLLLEHGDIQDVDEFLRQILNVCLNAV